MSNVLSKIAKSKSTGYMVFDCCDEEDFFNNFDVTPDDLKEDLGKEPRWVLGLSDGHMFGIIAVETTDGEFYIDSDEAVWTVVTSDELFELLKS